MQTPFASITPWRGVAPAGFDVNFLGQMTDVAFTAGWADSERSTTRYATPSVPGPNNEAAEWDCLFAGIGGAQDRFVMLEAGAGYGRWLVGAACALRMMRPDLPLLLIGIEADRQHYDWMLKHFRDNGLEPDEHRLICGGIAIADGQAQFLRNDDPAAWYGQTLADYSGYDVAAIQDRLQPVRTLSLETMIPDVSMVDVLDCDIQGAERDVIPSSIQVMNRKVKRAFVGTHFNTPDTVNEIDDIVYRTFSDNGWRCVAHQRPNTTIDGIYYDDGAQYWLNPRLCDT